jgi:hypothetical protein
MIRTQIQITPEQARKLKKMAAKEGKSMAELIRQGVDTMLETGFAGDLEVVKKRALAAAGALKGPADLSARHDDYLGEAFGK